MSASSEYSAVLVEHESQREELSVGSSMKDVQPGSVDLAGDQLGEQEVAGGAEVRVLLDRDTSTDARNTRHAPQPRGKNSRHPVESTDNGCPLEVRSGRFTAGQAAPVAWLVRNSAERSRLSERVVEIRKRGLPSKKTALRMAVEAQVVLQDQWITAQRLPVWPDHRPYDVTMFPTRSRARPCAIRESNHARLSQTTDGKV